MEMIKLTREEALDLLKALARFEGFLFSMKSHDCNGIDVELEYPVSMLSKKLIEVKK